MSEPHRIRLRGPWEIDDNKRTRRFGRPRLNTGERVWLVLEGFATQGTVTLNGEPLSAMLRQDVTERLKDRNILMLEGWDNTGQVSLEI